MQIKIAGHSGCAVEVVQEGAELWVRKTTTAPTYFARLRKQADKQEYFFQHFCSESFLTPKVLRRIETPECVGMDMEYVHARTFVDYFENAPYTAPNRFADRMIHFIERELEVSPVQTIPQTLLTEKWNSICRIIDGNELLNHDAEVARLQEQSAVIFQREVERRWPVGFCHGDLTLSNLLFQEGRIYLIDFLDSFLETPLMDLVKLRQDTRYFWSHLLCKETFDRVKSKIVLAEIDRRIWNHFKDLPGFADGYRELQCMSFWRILQYAHDPQIAEFLKRNIAEQLDEMQ